MMLTMLIADINDVVDVDSRFLLLMLLLLVLGEGGKVFGCCSARARTSLARSLLLRYHGRPGSLRLG